MHKKKEPEGSFFYVTETPSHRVYKSISLSPWSTVNGQSSEFKVQKNTHCLKFISFFKEKMCNFGESFMDFEKGEMSEWFKEHAWKVCILQKGIAGSNPALSARLKLN